MMHVSIPMTPHNKNKTVGFLILVIVLLLLGLGSFGLTKLFLRQHTNSDNSTVAPADTTAPTVTVTNSADLQQGELSGVFTVKIAATDNVGVVKAEFYVDGQFFAVSYAAPFTLDLDTAKLSAGSHTFEVRVYDKAGNMAHSDKLTFSVAAETTPTPSTNQKVTSSAGATTTSGSSSSSSSSGSSTPAPPDTTPPSAPTNLMLTADGAYVVGIAWTASTDNVGIASYKVYRDGTLLGSTTSTTFNDYTVVPGNTYSYLVKAYDAADNNTSSTTNPSITMAETSIWMNFDVPENFGNDASPIELGVKFRPQVDGKVTGIRFYKASTNTGPHVASLWKTDGTLLAQATFSNETASGWQQVNFSAPVPITAGTTYVASYHASNGHYADDVGYFANSGVDRGTLHALRSGVDGPNGVYSYSPTSVMPTNAFQSSNYWVDVVFASP